MTKNKQAKIVMKNKNKMSKQWLTLFMVAILKKTKGPKIQEKGPKKTQKNFFFSFENLQFLMSKLSFLQLEKKANSNKLFVGEIRNTARGITRRVGAFRSKPSLRKKLPFFPFFSAKNSPKKD